MPCFNCFCLVLPLLLINALGSYHNHARTYTFFATQAPCTMLCVQSWFLIMSPLHLRTGAPLDACDLSIKPRGIWLPYFVLRFSPDFFHFLDALCLLSCLRFLAFPRTTGDDDNGEINVTSPDDDIDQWRCRPNGNIDRWRHRPKWQRRRMTTSTDDGDDDHWTQLPEQVLGCGTLNALEIGRAREIHQ